MRANVNPVIPPIGKYWVFDVMFLRKKSIPGGFMLILRAINKSEKSYRRSYGLKDYSEASVLLAIGTLRAFVRPRHGEIAITKADSHQSHPGKARNITEY